MALNEITFSFTPQSKFITIDKEWSHNGVVGSGDLEVLIRFKEQKGLVNVKINTPVSGFDDVWKKVISKTLSEINLGNADIEINDNNATPFIVAMRIRQGIIEAKGGAV